MQTYRVEATVSDNGTLLINKLPFQAGDKVEVIVRSREPEANKMSPYPLRNTPIQYIDPFESIAEDAWDSLA